MNYEDFHRDLLSLSSCTEKERKGVSIITLESVSKNKEEVWKLIKLFCEDEDKIIGMPISKEEQAEYIFNEIFQHAKIGHTLDGGYKNFNSSHLDPKNFIGVLILLILKEIVEKLYLYEDLYPRSLQTSIDFRREVFLKYYNPPLSDELPNFFNVGNIQYESYGNICWNKDRTLLWSKNYFSKKWHTMFQNSGDMKKAAKTFFLMVDNKGTAILDIEFPTTPNKPNAAQSKWKGCWEQICNNTEVKKEEFESYKLESGLGLKNI